MRAGLDTFRARLAAGEALGVVLEDARGVGLSGPDLQLLARAAQASGRGYGEAGGGVGEPLPANSPLFVAGHDPASAIEHAKGVIADAASGRGEPKSALVNVGDGFGQQFTEGSHYPCGSMLVTAPDGTALPMVNGFYETYVGAREELGGLPLWQALGRPLDAEHAVDPDDDAKGVHQHFEHGRMHWDPASNRITIEPPDLLTQSVSPLPAAVSIGEAVPALKRFIGMKTFDVDALERIALDTNRPIELRNAAFTLVNDAALLGRLTRGSMQLTSADLDQAALRTFFVPGALRGDGHEAQFFAWGDQHIEANPHVGHVYAAVLDLSSGDDRPTTVGDLFARTRQIAAASLANDPLLPTDPTARDHLIVMTTLAGLAGHALKNNWGPASKQFPKYIPDGRPFDAGCDKAWHVTNQSMFAYVQLFDAAYGDGETAADFMAAAEDTDKWGAAVHIARTYDETRGANGCYLANSLPGPIGETTIYFPRPTDLNEDEARAYDGAVRIGDGHEYFPQFGDPTMIGANFRREDPLAEINGSFESLSSLTDAGVARDLTANRVGGWLGVSLFRDPSAFPALPWDDGECIEGQTFASGLKIPAEPYLAHELDMIATIRGTPRSDDVTIDGLRTALTSLVDDLWDTDRDTLARFYATYSVRHLAWGWRVEGMEGEEQLWAPHRDWALAVNKEDVLHGFLRRVDATEHSFA